MCIQCTWADALIIQAFADDLAFKIWRNNNTEATLRGFRL